jgi:asparagine synthase (glutamine-hydrolysing)
MLASLAVVGGETQSADCGESFALGVSRRFAGQATGSSAAVHVVCDTDLINLKALHSMLERGDRPPSSNAAELLASLYRLRGTDFINDLEGAFAFALWDDIKRRLLLVVDRLGIKSLYWRLAANYLTFSTRISGLRAADPSLEIDPAALIQFLVFSAVPAPLGIYAGTQKMPPGFVLTFEEGHVSQRQYWDLEFHEEQRSQLEWKELVREELRASVHRHFAGLRAQTTGAFLSGGTDSSTVVAFMSECERPVRTFSAIFKESAYSEESFVQTITDLFRTEQHNCCISPPDAISALPRIAAYYDEPFANSSAIAAYFCSLMARRNGVEMLLGGDGGDEIFAGNERYERDKYFSVYHRLPAWTRNALVEPLARLLPTKHRWLGLPRRYLQRAQIPNPQRFFSYNFFLNFPALEIFNPELLRQAPQEQWLEIPQAHFVRHTSAGELNRLLYMDIKMVLADNDIRKVSGMAELAGVQVRYPMLDHRLAELTGRIPERLKLRRFEKRYIFKQAMSGILPDRILYKKKHGMGVPVSSWLLHHPQLHTFALEVLHDPRTRQRGYFRPGFIGRLLDLQRNEHVAYYGEIVWYLLVLELWYREHFDRSMRLVCAG